MDSKISVIGSILLSFLSTGAVCLAQKPELVVQTGHSVAVTSVAFSADKRILAAGGGSAIKLWEVGTGRELRALNGHSGDVTSVAFSADGRVLASGSRDKTIKLWDVATGRELRTLTGHSDEVLSVAFNIDGKILASGNSGRDGTIRLWDVATGEELRRLKGYPPVAFSTDGKTLVNGGGPIILWDVATGRELRRLKTHSYVRSISFSVDGTTLAGGSDNTIKLWDVATGREFRTLTGHTESVFSVAFNADGKTLASGSLDHTIKLWDVASGQELRTLRGHSAWVLSVAISSDGKTLASGSWDNTIRLWDVASGQELRTLRGHSTWVSSVAFGPDGNTLAIASAERTIKLWDVFSGKEWRRLTGHTGDVNSLAFSPDGKTLVSGSSDETIKLWDVATGMELKTLREHSGWISSLAFSGDGTTLVRDGADYTIKIWDVASGKVLTTLQNETGLSSRAAVSADGKTLAAGSVDHTIKLWEAPGGKELRSLPAQSDWVSSVAFSPDGQTLASGNYHQEIKLWDVATGRELRTLQGPSSNQEDSVVAFSADGKLLASGSRDALKLWDVATGRELHTFVGHSNTVSSVAFSPDGKFLVSGSFDGTSKLWNVETGRLLASLIMLDKTDSAVVSPNGLFDASSGAQKLMHWMVGNEPIELEQLKARYYEPGLLTQLLQGRTLPDVDKFENPKLYPEVQYEVPSGGSLLNVNLTNRGGGIGRVQIFVNGKEFLADARDRQLRQNPNVKQAQLKIDLSKAASKLIGKENLVRVIAWNVENYISSRGEETVWAAAGTRNRAPPEIYAIVGGISQYAGSQLELNFAARDAIDVADAIEMGAKRLFGADKVHLTLLSTAVDPRASPPTKDNFSRAFIRARQAKPTDILIVYLAGHGVTLQRGSDTYYYLTKEARSVDIALLSDPEVRKRETITSEELVDWIKQIPALKQVIILDTCAAGAAQNKLKLMEVRAASGDAIRAIERAKDRTGSYILMGSAADAVSYEASRYGHGLLTYALLKGMKGPALNNDEFVDISKLFHFAREEVEQLARYIGGIQKPIIFVPNDNSFEVGQLNLEDRQKIALTMPKPMILRPFFFDAHADDDTLGLMKNLRALLRDESFVSGPGVGTLVFVDDDDFPGGIRPTGKYLIEGNQVIVTVRLRRDGVEIASAQVTATKANIALKVMETIKAALRKL